jgi:two-component system KDP operon response regulator KdpE
MKRVLLVEDDVVLRETLVELLRESPYSIVAIPLAEIALQQIVEHRPDLVLLDLGMPPGEMTGAEFLNRLRETPQWATLPVIIVSGLGDVVNPDLVSAMRVSAVLQKPFDVDVLLRAIAAAID